MPRRLLAIGPREAASLANWNMQIMQPVHETLGALHPFVPRGGHHALRARLWTTRFVLGIAFRRHRDSIPSPALKPLLGLGLTEEIWPLPFFYRYIYRDCMWINTQSCRGRSYIADISWCPAASAGTGPVQADTPQNSAEVVLWFSRRALRSYSLKSKKRVPA